VCVCERCVCDVRYAGDVFCVQIDAEGAVVVGEHVVVGSLACAVVVLTIRRGASTTHATAAQLWQSRHRPEKEAWNMPGTWKRTPPPHLGFTDTEQLFHSTEEMHQV
jgi:hypothetical protein